MGMERPAPREKKRRRKEVGGDDAGNETKDADCRIYVEMLHSAEIRPHLLCGKRGVLLLKPDADEKQAHKYRSLIRHYMHRLLFGVARRCCCCLQIAAPD